MKLMNIKKQSKSLNHTAILIGKMSMGLEIKQNEDE